MVCVREQKDVARKSTIRRLMHGIGWMLYRTAQLQSAKMFTRSLMQDSLLTVKMVRASGCVIILLDVW